MPLTDQELKQLLDAHPQVFAAFTNGQGTREALILMIDNNHPDPGNPIPATFHGLPVRVRFAQNFAVKPPRDNDETVD